MEGIHEGQIMTQEPAGWKQFPINQEITSEGLTLGVPAGWNKPASHRGRFSCREVAKTCGREAAGSEPRLARRVIMALKGAKPTKVPAPSRCRYVHVLEVGGSLKEDSKHQRKRVLGGCVRASRAILNA
jgi:hypothetical protein